MARATSETLKASNANQLKAKDLTAGEPVFIVEDDKYYIIDHINEDAVFFVGRGRGIILSHIGDEFHLFDRRPYEKDVQ